MGRYDTFIASITVNKPSKRANHGGDHTVRPYVSIICPYCNNEFQEVVLERLKAKKASICKAHLAQCPAYRILAQRTHDEMVDSREQVYPYSHTRPLRKQESGGTVGFLKVS